MIPSLVTQTGHGQKRQDDPWRNIVKGIKTFKHKRLAYLSFSCCVHEC